MIPNSVTVTLPVDYSAAGANKVGVIKAIRMVTGMSLKEAKELSEKAGPQRLDINVHAGEDYATGRPVSAQEYFDRGMDEFRKWSIPVTINAGLARLIDELRHLASEAVLRKEDDLAIHLIEVLKRFN